MAKTPPPVVLDTPSINRDVAATRKALRKLGQEYRDAIDKELAAVAAPIVAEAKVRYREIHPPGQGKRRYPGRKRTRGSQKGMRAGKIRSSPAVFIGNARYPYLQGQEWGSDAFPQFPDRRASETGRGSAGNFWWPAIEAGRDEAQQKIIKAIDRANGKVFRKTLGRGP